MLVNEGTGVPKKSQEIMCLLFNYTVKGVPKKYDKHSAGNKGYQKWVKDKNRVSFEKFEVIIMKKIPGSRFRE